MGTRSLTYIKEKSDTSHTLNIYKQFDGHPYAWGCQLAEFLSSKEIVNGIGNKQDFTKANSTACLIAQLVSEKKTEVGGLYIVPVDSKDWDQEYEYYIEVCDNTGHIYIKIYDTWEGGLVFNGTPRELINKYK